MTTLTPLHWRSATHLLDVTAMGSRLFKVTDDQFENWRWQMKNQVVSGADIPSSLQLSESFERIFNEVNKLFQSGITPYYLTLIDWDNPNCPIRLQSMPDLLESQDPNGQPDPLREVQNSPVKEVVHVYPDRVAFCVAQLCPVYCRYCFRKRRDDEVGLHFNRNIVDAGVAYIKSNKMIRDVLITGGDPLIAQDSSIEEVIRKLRAIEHVEIIRIGSRVPVTLPYRITPDLVDMLSRYHPIWVNTHFNCVEELTPAAARAIDLLLSRGIPVGNQSVFLKNVNTDPVKLKKLLQGLVKMRVRPYYIYHPQLVEGTAHFRFSIEEGIKIMSSLRGQTTGFSLPQYILDTPYGKVPLSEQTILGREGDVLRLKTWQGNVWEEFCPLP